MLAAITVRLGDSETVTRVVLAGLFAVLRPAEAAVRRLIAVAARDLVVTPRARRSAPSAPIAKGSNAGGRVPCFALFDPRRSINPKRRRTPGHGPNVRFFDGLDEKPSRRTPPSPDDRMSTARLRRRLEALLHALADIQKQARRLAGRYARQERPIRPMRPGRPPGFQSHGKREIDDILADCHELALIALAEPKFGGG